MLQSVSASAQIREQQHDDWAQHLDCSLDCLVQNAVWPLLVAGGGVEARPAALRPLLKLLGRRRPERVAGRQQHLRFESLA